MGSGYQVLETPERFDSVLFSNKLSVREMEMIVQDILLVALVAESRTPTGVHVCGFCNQAA